MAVVQPTAVLHITATPTTATTGTWTVTADLGNNPTNDLGLAAFSIDVDGVSIVNDSGVTIAKAAVVIQTLQVPKPPYTFSRGTGTITGPNLTNVTAAQDFITAGVLDDPTTLEFGDGLLTSVASPVYGILPARPDHPRHGPLYDR